MELTRDCKNMTLISFDDLQKQHPPFMAPDGKEGRKKETIQTYETGIVCHHDEEDGDIHGDEVYDDVAIIPYIMGHSSDPDM